MDDVKEAIPMNSIYDRLKSWKSQSCWS